MSRHLCALEALFVKLKDRYGQDDAVVRELDVELHALEALESRPQELHGPGRASGRVSVSGLRRSWDMPSNDARQF